MAMVSVEKGASPATAALEGRLLEDIAEERGVTAADVMFDVAAEDKLQTFFRISAPVTSTSRIWSGSSRARPPWWVSPTAARISRPSPVVTTRATSWHTGCGRRAAFP